MPWSNDPMIDHWGCAVPRQDHPEVRQMLLWFDTALGVACLILFALTGGWEVMVGSLMMGRSLANRVGR